MTQKLLPVGFHDLLFLEAEKNHHNINEILSSFFSHGYRLIKTPLIEFAENFSENEVKNSFHLTDVISGKALILRRDITPQISRLLATRLQKETLPLKICYVGDIICAQSDELYADRQQTQVGLEIIGNNNSSSNFEVIELLLKSLKKMQINDLLIEFSFTGFLENFLKENGIESSSMLLSSIMKKNLSEVRNYAGDKANLIENAMLNNEFDDCKLALGKEISQFFTTNFPEIKVRFNLFGDHNSSYYNEIYFDVFSKNFSYPIARGGRYKINEIDSFGATIYMNRLRKF